MFVCLHCVTSVIRCARSPYTWNARISIGMAASVDVNANEFQTHTHTHTLPYMENVNGECIICVKLHETIGANIWSSVKSDNVSIILTGKKNQVNCLVGLYEAKVMACIPLCSLIDSNDWHNIDVGPHQRMQIKAEKWNSCMQNHFVYFYFGHTNLVVVWASFAEIPFCITANRLRNTAIICLINKQLW